MTVSQSIHNTVLFPLQNLLNSYPYDVSLPDMSSERESIALQHTPLTPHYPPNYSESILSSWQSRVQTFIQHTVETNAELIHVGDRGDLQHSPL